MNAVNRLCALVLLCLAGAAPSWSQAPVPASAEAPALRTVSVNAKVTLPEKAWVQMPSQVWGAAIGGALGAGVIQGQTLTDAQKFKMFLDANKIDLAQIVRAAFQQKLSEPGSTFHVVEKAADFDLQLAITFYGIHPSGAFTLSNLVPLVKVRATLVDKAGVKVWEDSDMVQFPNKKLVVPRTMEEYFKAPQLLAEAFSIESGLVAANILKNR